MWKPSSLIAHLVVITECGRHGVRRDAAQELEQKVGPLHSADEMASGSPGLRSCSHEAELPGGVAATA